MLCVLMKILSYASADKKPKRLKGDDDVGLHVLGCRVDILGTNSNGLGVSDFAFYWSFSSDIMAVKGLWSSLLRTQSCHCFSL